MRESVNLCLSVSYNPINYVGADMETCDSSPYESWSCTYLHTAVYTSGY